MQSQTSSKNKTKKKKEKRKKERKKERTHSATLLQGTRKIKENKTKGHERSIAPNDWSRNLDYYADCKTSYA